MSEIEIYDPKYKLRDENEQQREKLRSATRYPILRKACWAFAAMQGAATALLLAFAVVTPPLLISAVVCSAGVVLWMFGIVILDIADSVQNTAKKE